ncbi:MAG: hypothetical protein GKR91_02625 [Pseudomonadales bacterium]|nr:hypothetical protein [Pseudomonadales bacterium]
MSQYLTLLKLIQAEYRLGLTLQDCLVNERQQLESQDLALLQISLCKKAELLTEIEAARETRNAYLARIGVVANPEELIVHLEKLEDSSATACVEALQECQESFNLSKKYNELNGLLIVNSRKRNAHKLDILKGVHEEQKIYNARGQTSPAGSQHSRKLA